MDKPIFRDTDALTTRAAFVPDSYKAEARTIDVVFATPAPAKRYSWDDGEVMEVLELTAEAVNLERMNNGANVLDNHGRYGSVGDVLGVVERAWVDGQKGYATIRFSAKDSIKEIVQDVADGILRNISVGYTVERYAIERTDGQKPTYRAVAWTPCEVSFVKVPADPMAQTRAAQDQETETLGNPARSLPKTKSMEELIQEVAGTNNAPTPTPQAPAPVAERQATDLVERSRTTTIMEVAEQAGLDMSFVKRHIDAGTTVSDVRAAAITAMAERQAPPARTATASGDETAQKAENLQSALIARYAPAAVRGDDEARARTVGDMSLRDMARVMLRSEGHNPEGMGNTRMMELSMRSQATSSFPVLLEGTARRVLRQAFDEAPYTWDSFCGIGSVQDYRIATRVDAGTFGTMDKNREGEQVRSIIAPDGEKHPVYVENFSNILTFTEEMFIDDDLGAMLRYAQNLGSAAALTIEETVFAVLGLNAGLGPVMSDGNPLFHARTNANSIGTSGVMTSATLDADRVKMGRFKDPSGNRFLNVRPAVLVVPLELESRAKVLNTQTTDPDASVLNATNIANGMFQTIVGTPRLSGTRRYIFTNPANPALEVNFLRGQRTPVIVREELFQTRGTSWRISQNFGVQGVSFRAAITNAGT